MRIRLRAVRTYFEGLSLLATCRRLCYECKFSREALRKWVARIAHPLRCAKIDLDAHGVIWDERVS